MVAWGPPLRNCLHRFVDRSRDVVLLNVFPLQCRMSYLDPKRDFRRLVDFNTMKAVECFNQLVKNAKIGETREDGFVEANRVSNLTLQMLHATEQLLTQIEQLRRILTLQDYDTINAELDEETRQLTQKRDALLQDIKAYEAQLTAKADQVLCD